MRKLLALALLACLAGPAWGDGGNAGTRVQSTGAHSDLIGGLGPDSAGTAKRYVFRVDSLGNLQTNGSRSAYHVYSDIFPAASSSLAITVADSSAALDTRAYSRAKLLLYVIPSEPVDAVVQLEVEVRTHPTPSRDSLNTFTEFWQPEWSSSAFGSSAGDSLSFGDFATATASTRQNGTVIVRFRWASGPYSTRGVSLNLPWVLGPYTSVRIRYLAATGSAGSNGAIKVKGYLVCTGS